MKKSAPKIKAKSKSKSAPKAKSKAKPAKAKPAKKAVAKASAKKIVKTKAAPKKSAKAPAKSSAASKIAKGAAALAGVGAMAAAAVTFGPKGLKKVAKNALENISQIFSPLDDRVIIEETVAETRTAGGLFIPDTATGSDAPKQGKVLAVGRGHHDKKGRLRPLDVQLGDMVLFEPYMGSPILFGDREVVVLRESQLLGVVKS